ncbi:hypothetical protein [Corynebacterium macginleyi]|uniref:Uncharacterized protein n=2 Tax=Corynebacterium macginleyi TaxID=38290 RepID=A0A3M0GCG8_9CORY|nr:hypothetical protein [Corynebacterium macginleyi]MBK4157741.1 hypothetical protein [Corynebacterium macginleyi]MBK4164590.1 hypothetical protein [Corynebacterium macginleyi]RMB60362.1 hypothetical protein D9543_06625 [Corynebacterium macginleyi]
MARPASKNPVTPPGALRVGGAFLVVAFVLVLFALISVFTDGWGAPFVWTYSNLTIIIAAVLVGSFSTMNKEHAGSRAQIIALAVAVALIIASRFLPQHDLLIQQQYWLLFYAGMSAICALILRRSVMAAS